MLVSPSSNNKFTALPRPESPQMKLQEPIFSRLQNLVAQWDRERKSDLKLLTDSDATRQTKTASYDAIIELGKLPETKIETLDFVVSKLREGNIFFIRAALEIMGISENDINPMNKIMSLQSSSKAIIKLYNESPQFH